MAKFIDIVGNPLKERNEFNGNGQKLKLNVSRVYDYLNISFDGSYNLVDTKGLSDKDAKKIIENEFEKFIKNINN